VRFDFSLHSYFDMHRCLEASHFSNREGILRNFLSSHEMVGTCSNFVGNLRLINLCCVTYGP